ncbi:MAG: QueT transporter family protein [Desulfurococcaceae archaeon]
MIHITNTESNYIRKDLISGVVIAATYAALVWVLQPISFGPIQVRVADMLSPLPYVMGFESVIGLTLGTFIANTLSPYGLMDMLIGTSCTFTYALINYLFGKLVGYRRAVLPIVAIMDSAIVGIFIGILLLSVVFGEGDPLFLFAIVFVGNLAATMPGALIIVPVIRKFYVKFKGLT